MSIFLLQVFHFFCFRKCKHTYDKKTAMKMLEKGQKSQKTVKCPVVGCSNKDPIVKVGLIHFSSPYQLGFSGSPVHRPRDSEESGKTEEEIKS